MTDFLDEFLSDIGYEGAETGADIVRMLGVKDPALQETFGQGLNPLFATVRTGLGELPGLLSTLTGQARTTAGMGATALGRAGRTATARAGFAGGGAIQREQRTGMKGIEAGLQRSLFGARERVESERAGLLGSVGTGIQNLLNALISGGVQFGPGGLTDPTSPGVGLGDDKEKGGGLDRLTTENVPPANAPSEFWRWWQSQNPGRAPDTATFDEYNNWYTNISQQGTATAGGEVGLGKGLFT